MNATTRPRWGMAALLLVLSAAPALAEPDDHISPTDELVGYCLGANTELVERFRKMQLWGCGNAPAMAWCREAKKSAPEAMRYRERLVMRFARVLSEKGLLDVEQPTAARKKLAQFIADGTKDAEFCFNPNGERDEAACDRLQRCAEAEKLTGISSK
jgi:hypothetical protein